MVEGSAVNARGLNAPKVDLRGVFLFQRGYVNARTVEKTKLNGRTLPFRSLPFYVLSVGAFVFVWQIVTMLIADTSRRFLLPTPSAVLARFIRLASDGTLLRHTAVTLSEMGLGLLLGTSLAVVLGYGVAHSKLIAYLLEPVIVTSQAVPIVALAPLLTVWFGPGLASKVVVCALIVFFPILVNVVASLKGIDPRLWDLFRMLEASPRAVLLKLEIPATLPGFLSGLKVSGDAIRDGRSRRRIRRIDEGIGLSGQTGAKSLRYADDVRGDSHVDGDRPGRVRPTDTRRTSHVALEPTGLDTV